MSYLAGVRSLVSGKRRRYQQDGFDLDLTFITPRVMAMGFPGEGLEGAYRNPLHEISRFFFLKFGAGNFLIINLAERDYSYARVDNSVLEMGFPDLHTCPLHLAFELAQRMQAFLDKGPRKVVAVHCLAGKGRTGVVVAAWLLCALAIRDGVFHAGQLEQGVPLACHSEGGAAGVGAPPAGAAVEPSEEELAAVDAAVPPAFELAARAVQAFRLLRGDGLNYTAQRRTLFYVAVVVREALIKALAGAGEGARLLAAPPGSPATAPRYDLALPLFRALAPPRAPTIFVWNLVLHGVPRLRGSPKASGCRPTVQLRSLPHQHLTEITLYDSVWAFPPGEVPGFQQDDEVVILHVNAVLSGDVLLRIMHNPGQAGESGSGPGSAPASSAAAAGEASSLLAGAMSALGAGLSSAVAAMGRGASAALQAIKPSYVAPRPVKRDDQPLQPPASPAEGGVAPSPFERPAGGAGAPSATRAIAAEVGEAAPLSPVPRALPVASALVSSSGSHGSAMERQLSVVLEGEREEEEEEEEEDAAGRDLEDAYDGPVDEAGAEAGEAAAAGGGASSSHWQASSPPTLPSQKPVEIFRYSFNTAFMDHQWGQGVHRVFRVGGAPHFFPFRVLPNTR
jgi:phosphatidylinositol-3,4,5-trisphosphate 3-phosphatase/dual-specificity protein phosphatase PTEN